MERTAAMLAALAALALPATASAQDLTADDVRQFFDGLGARAETAVEQGNWQGIQSWMQGHVADDATIAISGSLVSSDGPVMTYQASLAGVDLKRTSALSMASMGPQLMEAGAIRDYAATSSVADVVELPNGVIGADVTFREHGTLDLRALAEAAGGAAEGEAQIPAGALEPVTFLATAECRFRLARQGGEIVITLAACDTATTM